MFCRHFSYNLCTKASLVDSKPHFFQPCQIFCSLVGIGVSLRVEECEGSRHVHMLLLFQIADDDMLINIFTQHFLVLPLWLELFQCQRQLCFLYKESFGMFFLSNNKLKSRGWSVCKIHDCSGPGNDIQGFERVRVERTPLWKFSLFLSLHCKFKFSFKILSK